MGDSQWRILMLWQIDGNKSILSVTCIQFLPVDCTTVIFIWIGVFLQVRLGLPRTIQLFHKCMTCQHIGSCTHTSYRIIHGSHKVIILIIIIEFIVIPLFIVLCLWSTAGSRAPSTLNHIGRISIPQSLAEYTFALIWQGAIVFVKCGLHGIRFDKTIRLGCWILIR